MTTHRPRVTWGEWAFSKPKIYVDGYEMPVGGWGCTAWPVWPGTHNVHVQVRSPIRGPKMGVADATVQVHPGQLVELEYNAPFFGVSAGALGVGPQRYKGRGVMIALIAVPLVITMLVIIVGMVLTLMH